MAPTGQTSAAMTTVCAFTTTGIDAPLSCATIAAVACQADG